MTVWLTPDDVADRLQIKRRTAIGLMYQMNYSVISGSTRKRIRVSEQAFESFMLKHSNGKQPISIGTGTPKRLERRK